MTTALAPPVAKGCYRDFDFTILFENTILSILPSLMVILAASTRIWHLHRQQRLVAAGKLQVVKLVSLMLHVSRHVCDVAHCCS